MTSTTPDPRSSDAAVVDSLVHLYAESPEDVARWLVGMANLAAIEDGRRNDMMVLRAAVLVLCRDHGLPWVAEGLVDLPLVIPETA